jgi:nicotinamidase-related amidase
MPYNPKDDLHGNVPDQSDVCLLIIDMINTFTFDGAEEMLPTAAAAAERIAVSKGRVKATGLPVIYVNDNFGKWQSDFRKLVERCLAGSCRGKQITELLHPHEDNRIALDHMTRMLNADTRSSDMLRWKENI